MQITHGRPEVRWYKTLTTSMPQSTAYEVAGFFNLPNASAKSLSELIPNRLKSALLDPGLIECSPNLIDHYTRFGTAQQGTDHLAGRFVLTITDSQPNPAKRRYLLVSHEDAAWIQEGLKKAGPGNPNQSLSLWSLDGKEVAHQNRLPETEAFQKERQRVFLQAKLCLGKTAISGAEQLLLKELYKDKPREAVHLKALYESVIQYLTSAVKAYNNSKLQKTLGTLSRGPIAAAAVA